MEAKSQKTKLEEKRRFWQQHVEDWQAVQLSQAQYCRKNNLKVHRFIYWKKKFQRQNPSQALMELKLPSVPYPKLTPPRSSLRVSVNRFQVAVDRDFDPVTLKQLVYSLERL